MVYFSVREVGVLDVDSDGNDIVEPYEAGGDYLHEYWSIYLCKDDGYEVHLFDAETKEEIEDLLEDLVSAAARHLKVKLLWAVSDGRLSDEEGSAAMGFLEFMSSQET